MTANEHRIALITDSTCDIPREMQEQFGITIVPLYLMFGTDQYRDGVDIDHEHFYQRLFNSPVHPTTSQPTPQDFVTVLEQARADGAEEAVVITLSAKLSQTMNSAVQAQKMTGFPVQFHDSRSVSMGLGWQVMAAARARAAGADAAGMVRAAEQVRQTVGVVFTVDTLEYLHRGGRIGTASKLLGTALQLKPQLIVNAETGVVEPGARVRTRKKALDSVYEAFFSGRANCAPLHLTVMHIAAQGEAEALAERIQREHGPAELFITDTSPVIGVHGGPGTVGIVGYCGD